VQCCFNARIVQSCCYVMPKQLLDCCNNAMHGMSHRSVAEGRLNADCKVR